MDLSSISSRFWEKVNKTETCWVWTACKHPGGYGYIGILDQETGNHVPRLAHRISWLLEHGTLADDIMVLHKCDNKPCVRPDHLYLGTHADNMRDVRERKTGTVGEKNIAFKRPERTPRNDKHGMAKLTWNDINEIRSEEMKHKPRKYIAKLYNISLSHLSEILNLKTWRPETKHLSDHPSWDES